MVRIVLISVFAVAGLLILAAVLISLSPDKNTSDGTDAMADSNLQQEVLIAKLLREAKFELDSNHHEQAKHLAERARSMADATNLDDARKLIEEINQSLLNKMASDLLRQARTEFNIDNLSAARGFAEQAYKIKKADNWYASQEFLDKIDERQNDRNATVVYLVGQAQKEFVGGNRTAAKAFILMAVDVTGATNHHIAHDLRTRLDSVVVPEGDRSAQELPEIPHQISSTYVSPDLPRAKDENVSPQGKNIEVIRPSVVMIKTNDKSSGSGFVVAEDLIATNYHVIECASAVDVVFGGKTTLAAAGIVHLDASKDIAILKVPQIPGSSKPLNLLGEYPQLGTDVIAIGYPLGPHISVTKGIVSAVGSSEQFEIKLPRRDFTAGMWIRTDTPISSGNSGGPLFSVSDGQVVGMNTLGSSHGGRLIIQNVNYAISSVDIRTAIESGKQSSIEPFVPNREGCDSIVADIPKNPKAVLQRFVGDWEVSDNLEFDIWGRGDRLSLKSVQKFHVSMAEDMPPGVKIKREILSQKVFDKNGNITWVRGQGWKTKPKYALRYEKHWVRHWKNLLKEYVDDFSDCHVNYEKHDGHFRLIDFFKSGPFDYPLYWDAENNMLVNYKDNWRMFLKFSRKDRWVLELFTDFPDRIFARRTIIATRIDR